MIYKAMFLLGSLSLSHFGVTTPNMFFDKVTFNFKGKDPGADPGVGTTTITQSSYFISVSSSRIFGYNHISL